MKDNLYELSDGLFQLRRAFLSNESTGVVMSAEQVEWMGEVLFAFGQAALKQAHEISRHRWNAEARKDLEREDRVLEEAMRLGSNVALFPAIHRPFSDGIPGGAA